MTYWPEKRVPNYESRFSFGETLFFFLFLYSVILTEYVRIEPRVSVCVSVCLCVCVSVSALQATGLNRFE